MNPTEIRAALKEIGGHLPADRQGANKRLGQHFLIDKNILDIIVTEAEIEKGDRVLEIGPGLGVLTRALIDAGASVTAVERDRRGRGGQSGYLPPPMARSRSPVTAASG